MQQTTFTTANLTVKSKKYYLKEEVDTLVARMQKELQAQIHTLEQRVEEQAAALENYRAQERKIASVLISTQELAEQQTQLMREKAQQEMLAQEEKRRKVEKATAQLQAQKKQQLAEYRQLLETLRAQAEQSLQLLEQQEA